MNKEIYRYDEQELVIIESDGVLIAEWQKIPQKKTALTGGNLPL